MKHRIGRGLALAALGTLLFAAAGANAQQPVRIGSTLALTGPLAATALVHKTVGEIYVDQLNRRGGLLGRRVEWIVKDDQSKPDLARTLYEQLLTVDKVDLLMGPYATGAILSAMGVAQRYDKVLVHHTFGIPSLAKYECQFPAWSLGPVPEITVPNTVFNALAASFVMSNGLTITNLMALFERRPRGQPPVFVDNGLPIALGLVPFVFSLGVLALPAIRALFRARKRSAVAEEKARLAILREVLTRAPKKQPVPDEALKSAYRIATGDEPSSKEITRRVVELGGDVDVGPEGEVRYRFADLEAEAEALEEERAQASENEARLGKIVFTSET